MSPWFIKNWVYVGNPFFPFFYAWGNPRLSPWVQQAAAGYFRGVAEYAPRSLGSLLQLPWDIAFRSVRFGRGMDILGDYGWAPFVFLTPCLFFCRKRPAIARILLAYAALFFIPWALSRPVLRFLLPLAPVLALLSAVAWTGAILEGSRRLRQITRGILAGLLLLGFGFFFYVEGLIQPFPVALGLEGRDVYLSRKLNYYAAACFVNRLPEASRILVLGDQRGYYYNRPVIVSPVFNQNPLVAWANAASSPAELAARLHAESITHILVNDTEMARLNAAYAVFPFTPQGQTNWNGVRSGIARPLYRDRHCEVLSLP
jgi:hypothetical protein